MFWGKIFTFLGLKVLIDKTEMSVCALKGTKDLPTDWNLLCGSFPSESQLSCYYGLQLQCSQTRRHCRFSRRPKEWHRGSNRGEERQALIWFNLIRVHYAPEYLIPSRTRLICTNLYLKQVIQLLIVAPQTLLYLYWRGPLRSKGLCSNYIIKS